MNDVMTQRFVELAEKLGPQVIDAAMHAARMEAISSIICGVCAGIVAGGLAIAARWFYLKRSDDKWDSEIAAAISFILSLLLVCAAIIALVTLADVRVWTTLAHPEWWIAKKVLGL